MKRMIAITIRPGATTAAARTICPSPTRMPAARGHEHERERAEQLGEQPAILEPRVVEVLAIAELQHEPVIDATRALVIRGFHLVLPSSLGEYDRNSRRSLRSVPGHCRSRHHPLWVMQLRQSEWTPRLSDYVYVSLTNAVAVSPPAPSPSTARTPRP